MICLFHAVQMGWGLNDKGQLGHDREEMEVGLPAEVPLPEPAIALSAGYFHTLAVGESGSVWSWGCNGKGQLGLGQEVVLVREPRMVKALQGERQGLASSCMIATRHGIAFR